MMKNVVVTYNKNGYITYQRGNVEITAMLYGYDDIKKIVNFSDGLMTVIMKKGNAYEEEYVDFGFGLSMLDKSSLKNMYFSGVSVDNIILERA